MKYTLSLVEESEVKTARRQTLSVVTGFPYLLGTLVPAEEQHMAIEPYADNFIPVVPVEDELEHTDFYPFCPDQTCYCHEDDEAIAAVYQAVEDGLLTPDEATDFVLGRLL